MKKIFVFLILPLMSFSQELEYGNSETSKSLCTELKSRSFITDKNADLALNKILNTIGAAKRFVLQPCDKINNAFALTVEGIRYIYYDRNFMKKIANNTNSWASIFILAHEVGHHINGHTLGLNLSLKDNRKQELEADEFSGFVLGKLGSSLDEASLAISSLSSNEDDSYSTHPSKSKRLIAIKNGYNKALNQNFNLEKTQTQSADEYFYSGLEKDNKEDFNEAYSDYSKAIQLDQEYGPAIYNRALLNIYEFEEFNDGIDDIILGTKAAIEKNYKLEFFNLGNNDRVNLLEFIKTIENQLNKKAIIDFKPMQLGDVKETYADIYESKNKLGFNPKISIYEGIPKFINWFREYYN